MPAFSFLLAASGTDTGLPYWAYIAIAIISFVLGRLLEKKVIKSVNHANVISKKSL